MDTEPGLSGSKVRPARGLRGAKRLSVWWCLPFAGCLCNGGTFAATSDGGSNAGGPAALSSAKAELAAFVIEPGFKIELVASEPMVTAPVAIAFDENGRLFAAELADAPARSGTGTRFGRVQLLEGVDEDGSAKTSTTYADGLPSLSALACYGGGVFVAAAPDLVFLKSTKADSGADIRRVVLSGFGAGEEADSARLPNNLNWGLDNRIHGATAGAGGTLVVSNWPGRPVSLTDADFSFDPRTLAVFPEAGPAESGLTFDNAGHKFACDPDRPLRLALYDRRYFLRNPFFPAAPEMINVLSPATRVFRAGSGTQTNAAGRAIVPPAGGTATKPFVGDWLTHARGAVVYRGNAFPSNYVGNIFIAAPDAQAIRRVVLRDNGLGVAAERPAGESQREFLMSRDSLFHPVQLVNGPDGALYIVDHRDGRQQGRIYRVVPAQFKRPPPPQLGLAKSYDLVATLASSDGWRRDTAARLLFERQDPACVPLLSNMLSRSRLPLARVHALHALAGQSALREEHVLAALRDPDAVVREHGVRSAEQVITNGTVSNALWNQLKALAADPAPRVRFQLAFTLGEIRRPDKPLLLVQILNRDFASPWVQTAVLSSLKEGASDLFLLLAGNANFAKRPTNLAFLRELATMVGLQGRLGEASQVAGYLAQAKLDPLPLYTLLHALGEGLDRTRSSLALVDRKGALQTLNIQALNIAADPAFVEPLRAEAIRCLGFSSYTFADVGDWLLLLCNPPPVPTVQSAAVATLGQFDDPGVFTGLVKAWPAMSLALRTQAVTALLSRTSRVGLVLDAVEQRRIPLTDLTQTQINFLRTYRDPGIRNRAVKLFGPVVVRRPDVMEKFKPALSVVGNAGNGRQIFTARCAQCHQFGAGGQGFGPDLTGAKTRGKQQLLEALLEPNASLVPGYAARVIETQMSQNQIGLVTDENAATLTLREPGAGRAVWPRLNVASIQVEPWSFMPIGLEQGLSSQDIADLLEFLATATP